jgi:RNA polymerase sigma-70 factor, ECF subfamily
MAAAAELNRAAAIAEAG